MKHFKKITYNAPVVLTFALVSLGALLLNMATGGKTNGLLFSVYRSSAATPMFYVRLFGHVLGHVNWAHYSSNMLLLLLTGPMLEEKYGSKGLLKVILLTALTTGLVQVAFFPNSALLGASGVVFAFILLASVTGTEKGSIPLTLLVVAAIYLGQQLYQGIAVQDNVSNLTHIIGGILGGVYGMALRPKKET
ncbi:MAG: rhomboid family intramembrane serine protease [Oscillospiraceae bacterium]|nr:rhomboid family intramembrane serine protease [Oscillospiraceae bacterium]